MIEEQDQNGSIWLSIGDLMSGLMMFFALLFLMVLAELHETREQVIDRRTAVVDALLEALEANDLQVEANEDGEITFKEEMLFDRGSARLSRRGEALLTRFAPVYADVILSNPTFDEEVSRIILEGHTSSEGGEMYNLDLSLRRAHSVAAAMFNERVPYRDPTHAERLKDKLYPAGRGPWDAADDVDESDRKVVLRLQFRGEDFVAFLTKP